MSIILLVLVTEDTLKNLGWFFQRFLVLASYTEIIPWDLKIRSAYARHLIVLGCLLPKHYNQLGSPFCLESQLQMEPTELKSSMHLGVL